MDIDQAKNDVRAALRLIPKDALDRIGGVMVDHLDAIAARLPEIIELLWPSVRTAMMQGPAGMLDLPALEKAWWELASEFGWTPKAPPAGLGPAVPAGTGG
jgi:hypothetical protein